MLLTTERLRLRPLAMADAPALFAILGDPGAMAFWDRPPFPRIATVEAMLADELAAMAAGGFLYWTVLKDNDAIGGIDLSHMDGTQAWTGFLFRRDIWGHGYAREALGAVIAYAFGPAQNLNALLARIRAGNARAARLLAALGFGMEVAPAPEAGRRDDPQPWLRYRLDKAKTK